MKEVCPFQSSDAERERLIAQSGLVAPLTRRLFERAGITAGMRVLDIGSGSGDVALLAAQLVGPTGDVTGIDRDPAQVKFAEQRAKTHGLANVHFVAGDFREMKLAPAVDAIVGRLVLMYEADPLDALRCALRNLKSGGILRRCHELRPARSALPRKRVRSLTRSRPGIDRASRQSAPTCSVNCITATTRPLCYSA